MDSIQKLARMAGLQYLVIVITGFYGILYVSSQITVKSNAAATMQNMLNHEFLFRSGITAKLIGTIAFIFLVLVLYRIFKSTHEYRAKLMVFLVIVQIPIVFVLVTFNFSALMVAKGNLLSSLSITERQEFVYFLLRTYKLGIIILMIFWGLWLIPFGQLVLKSGYMPKFIGYLLIIGGWAYVIESLDYILLDEMLSLITDYTFVLYSVAELSTVAWLLIKGIKTPK